MYHLKTLTFLVLVLAAPTLWTGMSARASTSALAPASTTCRGVTLQLLPGVRGLDGTLVPGVAIPRGWPAMSLNPVYLPAPLYPDADASSIKPTLAFYHRLASAYEKTAVAVFTIPVTAASGLNWAARAFPACGFQEISRGTTSQNGLAASGLVFQSSTNPDINISVSVQGLSTSQSLLVYYGVALSLPQRPQDTYVPARERRVTLTYVFPDGRQEWRLSISNSQLIATLVNSINGGGDWGWPKRPDYVSHSCFSPYNRGGAVLDFVPASGKDKVIAVDYGCRDFGTIGSRHTMQPYNKVDDFDRSVWYAVSYVAYRYCGTHKCKRVSAR